MTNGEDCYKVLSDGSNGYAVLGLDTRYSGAVFKDMGYSITEGSLIPCDIALAKKEEVLREFYDDVEEKFSSNNISLTLYQKFAITSRVFNCGSGGAYTCGEEELISAYKKYWKNSDDKYSSKQQPGDYNHALYTKSMNKPVTSNGEYMAGLEKRRKAEFTLFQCGYYTYLDEWIINETSSSGGDIIEVAKSMKEKMVDNNFKYNLARNASSFSEALKGSHRVCCAEYVCWVLQDAGYITEYTASSKALAEILDKKSRWTNFKAKASDINKLKAGDVIWYYNGGHSEIYAGNKKSYNAGCDSHLTTKDPTSASFTDGGKYTEFKVYRYSGGSNGSASEVKSNKKGIKGIYTSAVSGRKYTEYYQNIKGTDWYSTDGCFHCSIATIISGFGSNITPNNLNGFSYGSGCNGNSSAIFSSLSTCKVSNLYTSVSSSNIKKELKNGNALYVHITGSTLKTDTGSSYYDGHWVAVLDYKHANGKDKIYIHNPWDTGATGWADLTTVCNAIAEYKVVSKK